MQPEQKPVSASALEREYMVLDGDLNPLGTLYGGRFVAIVDALAARVAREHTGYECVTASMDSIHFLRPIFRDQTLIIKIAINRVWESSMEIGIKVLLKEGCTPQHVASAYMTFVALNAEGKKVTVPQIIPETHEEKRRNREAQKRRQARLRQRLQHKKRSS